jgi:hypothetical protein
MWNVIIGYKWYVNHGSPSQFRMDFDENKAWSKGICDFYHGTKVGICSPKAWSDHYGEGKEGVFSLM